MIAMQEVVPEMYPVLKERLSGWSLRRLRGESADEACEYFNVTAVKSRGRPYRSFATGLPV